MRIAVAAALCLCAAGARADVNPAAPAAGSAPQIVLPKDGDEYSTLAARTAAGDKDVDFLSLRLAYLKSAAYKRGDKETDLRKTLFDAVKSGDDKAVRDAAVALISERYIDLWGHKFLRQACEKLHDDTCAQQAHFVEFGLLKSIVSSGDGKTCKTGWQAVTVDEEYFMLGMLDVDPNGQSLIDGPPVCDRLDVVDAEGKPASYFFRIDDMMAAESALFEKR